MSNPYATAVVVQLNVHDQIVVCASRGLDDLLDGVRRRNPIWISPGKSRQRLARDRLPDAGLASHVTN